MVELGDGLTLRVEAVAEFFVLAQLVLENFNGDQPVQPVAAGLVDHRHAAEADGFQNFIPTIQETADVLIVFHDSHSFPRDQTMTRTQVTLSGDPRLSAMSNSRLQQLSLFTPWTTSKRIS